MILKLSILFVSLFSFTETIWVNFTPISGDYSFEIKREAKYLKKNMGKGFVEIFTVVGNGTPNLPDYQITMTKVVNKSKFKFDKISSEIFKENYLKTCQCKIISDNIVKYKNSLAIVYTIGWDSKNTQMRGIAVHIVKGNNLYNINFVATQSGIKIHKSDFKRTLKTLVIHK